MFIQASNIQIRVKVFSIFRRGQCNGNRTRPANWNLFSIWIEPEAQTG
jgi:hypothetical protein